MSELTQRKPVALEIGASPPSSSMGDKSIDPTDSELVRAIEFDIRPLCANEPSVRYLRQGEHLIPTVRGIPLGNNTVSRYWMCCSIQGIMRECQEMFLPVGYPDSVSEDYLQFQCWDTIQAMCSYLRGVLATQSVLQSVGVGDDKATPLAAALQWVLRDGSGMLGGLTFAYFVGPKFDMNVKRWRLFADVINDIGLTLDMMAPYFPSLVTEILCISSICKTMCGVAAGSTRSSLMTHFAKRDNMADCAAKEGSQETVVKLFGLICGMSFANAVNSSPLSVWIAFLFLTLIHVYANYQAVSGLCIPTLNRSRALILIQRYMELKTGTPSKDNTKFSIRSVNSKEPIFTNSRLPIHRIHMGAQLYQAIGTPHDLDHALQLYADERYVLLYSMEDVYVIFQAEMKPRDELRAYFQAVLVLDRLEKDPQTIHFDLLQSTYERMHTEFDFFYQQIQTNGWKTHMFLLNTSPWRIKLKH